MDQALREPVPGRERVPPPQLELQSLKCVLPVLSLPVASTTTILGPSQNVNF
jgi:hypothetical protein